MEDTRVTNERKRWKINPTVNPHEDKPPKERVPESITQPLLPVVKKINK